MRLWAHTCGFRGHFLTKSQRYSTTFAAFGPNASGGGSPSGERTATCRTTEEVEFREWTYEGSGYRTAGDVCLARNMEEDLRVGRMLAREEGGARATRAVAEMEGGER